MSRSSTLCSVDRARPLHRLDRFAIDGKLTENRSSRSMTALTRGLANRTTMEMFFCGEANGDSPRQVGGTLWRAGLHFSLAQMLCEVDWRQRYGGRSRCPSMCRTARVALIGLIGPNAGGLAQST